MRDSWSRTTRESYIELKIQGGSVVLCEAGHPSHEQIVVLSHATESSQDAENSRKLSALQLSFSQFIAKCSVGFPLCLCQTEVDIWNAKIRAPNCSRKRGSELRGQKNLTFA